MKLLHLKNVPIYKQLQIEEALLRTDDNEWCIINTGSSPAIVLGISGDIDQHVNTTHLPLIRRFSGGGTVVIDESTCFITLIGNKTPRLQYPDQVMQWTKKLYAFLPDFQLHEQDYAIRQKKFGGNAQHFTKNRWLHHSTLLWDYSEELMQYLKIPPKMPKYRVGRNHSDFLCRLKDYLPSQETLFENLLKELQLTPTDPEAIAPFLKRPHRKALKKIC